MRNAESRSLESPPCALLLAPCAPCPVPCPVPCALCLASRIHSPRPVPCPAPHALRLVLCQPRIPRPAPRRVLADAHKRHPEPAAHSAVPGVGFGGRLAGCGFHRAPPLPVRGVSSAWRSRCSFLVISNAVCSRFQDSSQIELLKELMDLQKDMVVMLLSMLEGSCASHAYRCVYFRRVRLPEIV